MKALALWMLRGYKRWISPSFPVSCRYVPTCSEYAMEAVERFGVVRGGAMAVWRLLRCHPLAKGGLDLVVKNERPSAAKAACIAGSHGMAKAMPLQSDSGTGSIRVPLT